MTFHGLDSVSTFQRNLSIQSVIDYIYADYGIQHMITDSNIEHLKPQWSDHALLSVKFTLGESQIRPGLCISPDLSPQMRWEAVKSSTKQAINSFGTKYVSWQLVDISALKAGIVWREHGERSARYLKQVRQQ
ncbi:hypothetical protein MFLAVUS_003233 [Mucor flavus]|uniref:Uncharacterized protein n=1 Tax=Mucor flavus TaxID=439312 RepID=A0ABP9YSJ2_9FUNG